MVSYNIYFSPTGTTERVVKHMGESFGSMENIDLSRRDMKNHEMEQGDFCIVGVPVTARRHFCWLHMAEERMRILWWN